MLLRMGVKYGMSDCECSEEEGDRYYYDMCPFCEMQNYYERVCYEIKDGFQLAEHMLFTEDQSYKDYNNNKLINCLFCLNTFSEELEEWLREFYD